MIRYIARVNDLLVSALKISLVLIAVSGGCGLSSLAQTSQVIVHDVYSGDFSDPYHVPYNSPSSLYIAGTTHQYLVCASTNLSPDCAQETPVTLTYSSTLTSNAAGNNVTIASAAGLHPYQMTSGGTTTWIMAVTLKVQPNDGSSGWSVIAHATPDDPTSSTPPTTWVADNLIIGSFANNVDADYDGKYFQDSGQLYLIYQKELSASPHRDGIVAQAMDSPTQHASSGPVTMLAPNPDTNPLMSEWYYPNNHTGNLNFKLVETGNIRKINGKYVMAYSVGAFNRTTYKLALAWSDTFLGPYTKVTQVNPDSIWGTTGPEVLYLLQSEQSNWPNYVANQVLSPGVPTVAQIGSGTNDTNWVILFAGYDPSETESGGTYDAGHRRTRYVALDFNVPDSSVTVAGSTNAQIKGWLTLHQN